MGPADNDRTGPTLRREGCLARFWSHTPSGRGCSQSETPSSEGIHCPRNTHKHTHRQTQPTPPICTHHHTCPTQTCTHTHRHTGTHARPHIPPHKRTPPSTMRCLCSLQTSPNLGQEARENPSEPPKELSTRRKGSRGRRSAAPSRCSRTHRLAVSRASLFGHLWLSESKAGVCESPGPLLPLGPGQPGQASGSHSHAAGSHPRTP